MYPSMVTARSLFSSELSFDPDFDEEMDDFGQKRKRKGIAPTSFQGRARSKDDIGFHGVRTVGL